MLLDGSVKEALHHAVITHALDDVPLQSMLGGNARGHEPLLWFHVREVDAMSIHEINSAVH